MCRRGSGLLLRLLPFLILKTGTVIPVTQVRPLKLSEMKNFVQGHTAKYQDQDSTVGMAGSRPQHNGLHFPLNHIASNVKSKTRPNMSTKLCLRQHDVVIYKA